MPVKERNFGVGQILCLPLHTEYLEISTWIYNNITISNPASIYLLKVNNNRNPRAMCKICSKLTIKVPERCHWRHQRCSGVFIVNSLSKCGLTMLSKCELAMPKSRKSANKRKSHSSLTDSRPMPSSYRDDSIEL